MDVVIIFGGHPGSTCNSALIRGEIGRVVQWVKRYRGGKESGALMWLLGAIERASGWHCNAHHHVAGGFNNVKDTSRWAFNDSQENMVTIRPGTPWPIPG